MENKKQDVNSLEELFKVVNAYSGWFANLADELSKVLADIQTSKKEEDTWEMKCPYEYGDKHYCIQSNGAVFAGCWECIEADNKYFSQGNIFQTEEAAQLESKRRNLLTRFRAFRDECNGDWKVDWNTNDAKWSISKNEDGLSDVCTISLDIFATFGYFKNQADCERAIELFGVEIKELFVDCEGE